MSGDDDGDGERLTVFGLGGFTLQEACSCLDDLVRARWGRERPPAAGVFDPPFNGRAVLDLVELPDDGRTAP